MLGSFGSEILLNQPELPLLVESEAQLPFCSFGNLAPLPAPPPESDAVGFGAGGSFLMTKKRNSTLFLFLLLPQTHKKKKAEAIQAAVGIQKVSLYYKAGTIQAAVAIQKVSLYYGHIIGWLQAKSQQCRV